MPRGFQVPFIFRWWNGGIATSPPGLAPRRPLLAFALTAVAAGVAFVAFRSGGPRLRDAVASLGGAHRGWIVVAGACFLSAALASAAAWRSALLSSAGTIGYADAAARYSVGGLVNTFVPLRMGDAVRVGLLSKAFESGGRLAATTGVLAFLAVARMAALLVLLLPAAVFGLLPVRMLWPTGAVLAVAVLGAYLLAPRRVAGVVGRFLDAFRLIGRSPAATLRVIGWLLASTLARAGAAAASAAALGAPRPIAAAAIMVPALELSSALPLTPGNVGITSGVVALALRAQGVDLTTALAVGIGFHAIETVVGITFGLAGATKLAPETRLRPRVRRVAGVAGGLAGAAALAALLGVFLDVA
jgi:uncharacterized membrane protein YbhN (UPF0104 family)